MKWAVGGGLESIRYCLCCLPKKNKISISKTKHSEAKAHGMEVVSLPIPDRQVPKSEAKVVAALEKLEGDLSSEKDFVLHCRQGIGRTGLLAACLLVMKGFDPETAVKRLSVARGATVPETQEQRRWLDHFAAILASV